MANLDQITPLFKRDDPFHEQYGMLLSTEVQIHSLIMDCTNNFRYPTIEQFRASLLKIQELCFCLKGVSADLHFTLGEKLAELKEE